MPETQTVAPARRRVIALTLVAGTALGLLTTAGLTTAAPAAADISGRVAVIDRGELRTEMAEATTALEAARTALTTAATTVAEVEASGLDVGAGGAAIDTTALLGAIDALADDEVTSLVRPDLTADAVAQTTTITEQTASLSERLDVAVEKKKAEEAAAARIAAVAAANTPEGARDVAARIAAEKYGWGADQFSCLNSLWQKESGWNYQAYNQNGGATGIPQALPGDKMATFGSDWATNASTQIRWGLDYISRAYGTPCSAWGHSQSVNWY
ncbi:phospholipase [Microbacterium abyssi]|uniref:aggregation-promoting factor C-terminal-like domain-containing protein n=1 Tax=Microbacterium abyssi TaxID=2782166 RepID=UPI00188929B4|nr:phospholipase [Microbacterium sp. A18JL241]